MQGKGRPAKQRKNVVENALKVMGLEKKMASNRRIQGMHYSASKENNGNLDTVSVCEADNQIEHEDWNSAGTSTSPAV